jgi:glucose 1-dehydrogenase
MEQTMQRLLGKVALITGSSRGIGRGCAICMAEEGADVLVNYRSHPEEAQAVVDTIQAMGRKALAWQADVSERAEVQAMFDGAVKHFGHIDIVVSNAARSIRQPVIDADWANVEATLRVSQMGVFHTCQFAAKQMVAQGHGGKIIIISSIHAELPVATSAAYNMAKAAINHLGATLANELTPHRINVNVINPGWIDTPGERVFYSEEELKEGAKRMPWGRLGTERDMGRIAVFLASDDADYVTGAVLRADGGYMVHLTLAPVDNDWQK